MTLSRTLTALGFVSLILMGTTAIAKPAVKPVPLAPEAQAAILRDDALKANVAYEFVSELTTRFGARPAASESERNAAAWAADTLKGMGFEKVSIETFPLYGWKRGPESIEITAPFPQKLVGTALGGSTGSAAGGLEAEAVIYDTYQEFLDSTEDVKGKIVVILQPMAQTSDGSGYGRMSGTVRWMGPVEAQKRGAAGFVLRSLSTDTHRFAHAGASAWQDGKGIPSMAISVPDALAISRIKKMQTQGKAGPLRLKMLTTAEFLPLGTSQNVVGEITGSESPDEAIIIGGHMDSWDLGTGAIDDGAGLAITVAAAKSIIDHGLRPKRTIRVVLWGSEEVSQPPSILGTGGEAFANRRKAELDRYVDAGESDFGADKILSITLSPTEDKAFVTKLGNLLYPLGIFIDGNGTPSGGSDSGPLHEKGVPAFDLNQDGYSYFNIHHTADDVLERIDPAQLNQNVAAWVATIWMMADTKVTFKRPEVKAEK
jgi:carboxypeptidase Q